MKTYAVTSFEADQLINPTTFTTTLHTTQDAICALRSQLVDDIGYNKGYATPEEALAAYEEYQAKCSWWDSFDSLALITHYIYTKL